jgi:hypothetical protein
LIITPKHGQRQLPQLPPRKIISVAAADTLFLQNRLSSQLRAHGKINLQKEENFQRPLSGFFSPCFTTNPPRFHHQKTTFCTPLFSKTPAKTHIRPPTILNPGTIRFAAKTNLAWPLSPSGFVLKSAPSENRLVHRRGRLTQQAEFFVEQGCPNTQV